MRIFSHQSSNIFILFCSPLIGAHTISVFLSYQLQTFSLYAHVSAYHYLFDMHSRYVIFFIRKSHYIYIYWSYEFNKIFCIYYRILRICVTRNISKTVSNIKSMYCGEEKAVQKKCVHVCYCCIFIHVQRMYYFSSSSYYNLMSTDIYIFYRSSRSFLFFPVFSIISFALFSTPGAA